MDGHQLDRHTPIPFYIPPSSPHPQTAFLQNVPLLSLCGSVMSSACMRYACRLECARRLCLCVPECEITPSGVLESREGRAASGARCSGCGLVPDTASLHIWNETPPPPHTHTHVPDSIWHKLLAVTLSVYWPGCPDVADQPLGLREAPSCFPTPSPAAPPWCILWDSYGNSHPRKWGNGGSKKTFQGWRRGGKCTLHEDMPPAIHNTAHLDRAGKMGGSADRRSPHQARPPERNGHFKCLSESSGSLALAPCSGGGKEEGIMGKGLMKESSSPAS